MFDSVPMPASPTSPVVLDHAAAARWPVRAAAHVLGLGLVAAVISVLAAAPSDLDRFLLPKETLIHIATWIAVVLARPVPPRGLRPAALIALATFLGISALSTLFAGNLWLATRALALSITAAAAFITARHIAAAGAGEVLLGWCRAAGIIGAAGGLAQAYGFSSPLFAATRSPGGTFGNRNFMAHFAALALPLLVIATVTTRRTVLAVLGALCTAALTAAIVLSRSRAAWIGAAAGVLVLGAVFLVGRKRGTLTIPPARAMLVLMTVMAGIAAAVALPNTLSWRSKTPYAETLVGLANNREGSGRGRMLQYRNTLQLAERHPVLGVGPGNWGVRYADVAGPSDPSWSFSDVVPLNPWPSSDWMALVSERGVAAVIAVLLLVVALAWRGILGVRAGGSRAVAGGALLAVLLAAGVQGAFDAVLLLPVPLLFTALAAGALLDGSDDGPHFDAALLPSRPTWARALPILLGVIAVRSAMQTTAYLVAGNGHDLSRLVWAARVDPGSYPIRIALAERLPCADAKSDIQAVKRMAPKWPAVIGVAKRCGK